MTTLLIFMGLLLTSSLYLSTPKLETEEIEEVEETEPLWDDNKQHTENFF